jgi:hypothetical protein
LAKLIFTSAPADPRHALLNSAAGYGAISKLFQWLIVIQYTSANIILRTPAEATTLGLSQDTYYTSR